MGEHEGLPLQIRNLGSTNRVCSMLYDGGEGGIRTRQDPLDSVSCRFYIAAVAVNASVAVAPCTPLHAGWSEIPVHSQANLLGWPTVTRSRTKDVCLVHPR